MYVQAKHTTLVAAAIIATALWMTVPRTSYNSFAFALHSPALFSKASHSSWRRFQQVRVLLSSCSTATTTTTMTTILGQHYEDHLPTNHHHHHYHPWRRGNKITTLHSSMRMNMIPVAAPSISTLSKRGIKTSSTTTGRRQRMAISTTSCLQMSTSYNQEEKEDSKDDCSGTFTSFPSNCSVTWISDILGGDYAGQSATFSSLDGSLVRVPEQYVPESLIEWGQIPGCLEVIVSEDLSLQEEHDEECLETNSGNDRVFLTRTTVTVMPEVGCGLDNLDTLQKQNPRVPVDMYKTFQNKDGYKIATCLLPTGGKKLLECIFVRDANVAVAAAAAAAAAGDEDVTMHGIKEKRERIRTRVSILLQDNHDSGNYSPCSLMEVIQERQTCPTSSQGRIAHGGGLDARTVMELVGKDRMNKPFCEDKIAPTMIPYLVGRWKQNVILGNSVKGVVGNNGSGSGNASEIGGSRIQEYSERHWNSDLATSFILPGNVLVRKYNKDGGFLQSLEICLLGMNHEKEESLSASERERFTHRVVVQYDFQDVSDRQHGPTVECYYEEKVESQEKCKQ